MLCFSNFAFIIANKYIKSVDLKKNHLIRLRSILSIELPLTAGSYVQSGSYLEDLYHTPNFNLDSYC